MAQITLLYFAAVRSALPSEPASQTVTLPTSPAPFPLAALRSLLTDEVHKGNDELKQVLERCAWSVNEEMVDDQDKVLLSGGEVVCPIPPVSGG